MKSPAELGFTQYDRRRLTQALKRASDARTYRRLQAVLLIAKGYSVPEVAQITGASVASIYQWVCRYLHKHRIQDLIDAPKDGRPRAASCITAARIERQRQRDPLRLGYQTTTWTVALLASHLSRRYRCVITARTLRRRMRQLGLRWKRPRYVYALKDPHRAQKKGLSFGG